MPTNPYAFPQPCAASDGGIYMACEKHSDFGGMELRDWFAGQALVGAMTGITGMPKIPDSAIAELAHQLYRMADALLVEREKR